LTNSRSGDRETAFTSPSLRAGAGVLACAVAFSSEPPARIVPADAINAAYPNSLRLSLAEAGFLLGAGAHVPHPVGLHAPHPLAEALITPSGSPIAISSFECHYSSLDEQRQRAADAALCHMADDAWLASRYTP